MSAMKKIVYSLMIGTAVLTAGCKKSFYDVNTNPNQPTSVAPGLVLTNALNTAASELLTDYDFANLWMGYWSYSGNYAIATPNLNYQFTNSFNQSIFNNTYDIINDFDYVEKKANESGDKFSEGVGKVMKAFLFSTLVDVYNDIPYSDALKGTSVVNPTYQGAQSIYEDLITQLSAGIDLIKTSPEVLDPKYDIMFGNSGDSRTMWVKFANTVKLRLLLNQSEKADRASYITSEIANIVAEGSGFLGVGEDAQVNPGYINSDNKQNPFWIGYGFGTDGAPTGNNNIFRAHEYAIDWYNTNGDWRLRYFYSPIGYGPSPDNLLVGNPADNGDPNNDYVGNVFGDQGIPNTSTSPFGPGILRSFDMPAPLITASESLFMQAEAAQRGWINDDPETLYNQGVIESFNWLQAKEYVRSQSSPVKDSIVFSPAATAARYLANGAVNSNPDVDWASAPNKLALIIRQKWAALNTIDPLATWNDYRRLHLPADVPLSVFPGAGTTIPVRLLYPQREYDVNGASVPVLPANAQFTDKIWWMN